MGSFQGHPAAIELRVKKETIIEDVSAGHGSSEGGANVGQRSVRFGASEERFDDDDEGCVVCAHHLAELSSHPRSTPSRKTSREWDYLSQDD